MLPETPFEVSELDQIRQALDEHAPAAPEGSAMLQRFWEQQHQTVRYSPPSLGRRFGSARRATAYWVGGAAMMALGGITLLSKLTRHETPKAIEYSAAVGTTTKLTLGDGTTVVLAPATRIQANGRSITLHGEAKFSVAHGAKAPFTVTIPATKTRGSVVTRVLGTEFAIRAYDNDVRVAVADGRVAVEDVVVGANTIVRVDSHGTSTTMNAPTAEAFAFAQGNLVLRDVPVRDAAHDIARWFGLELRFADPTIGGYPLTGTFTASSAGSLVEILSHTLPVRVEREGRVLTLYPRVNGRGVRHAR